MAEHGFAVTQKAIVLNGAGKLLALHRTETAPTRPLHWDLPGGQLDHGEDPTDGIVREIGEETGLQIEDVQPFDVSAKTHGDVHWVTICYTARAVSTAVVLSFEHDEFAWVTPAEFLALKISDKLRQYVEKLPKETSS